MGNLIKPGLNKDNEQLNSKIRSSQSLPSKPITSLEKNNKSVPQCYQKLFQVSSPKNNLNSQHSANNANNSVYKQQLKLLMPVTHLNNSNPLNHLNKVNNPQNNTSNNLNNKTNNNLTQLQNNLRYRSQTVQQMQHNSLPDQSSNLPIQESSFIKQCTTSYLTPQKVYTRSGRFQQPQKMFYHTLSCDNTTSQQIPSTQRGHTQSYEPIVQSDLRGRERSCSSQIQGKNTQYYNIPNNRNHYLPYKSNNNTSDIFSNNTQSVVINYNGLNLNQGSLQGINHQFQNSKDICLNQSVNIVNTSASCKKQVPRACIDTLDKIQQNDISLEKSVGQCSKEVNEKTVNLSQLSNLHQFVQLPQQYQSQQIQQLQQQEQQQQQQQQQLQLSQKAQQQRQQYQYQQQQLQQQQQQQYQQLHASQQSKVLSKAQSEQESNVEFEPTLVESKNQSQSVCAHDSITTQFGNQSNANHLNSESSANATQLTISGLVIAQEQKEGGDLAKNKTIQTPIIEKYNSVSLDKHDVLNGLKQRLEESLTKSKAIRDLVEHTILCNGKEKVETAQATLQGPSPIAYLVQKPCSNNISEESDNLLSNTQNQEEIQKKEELKKNYLWTGINKNSNNAVLGNNFIPSLYVEDSNYQKNLDTNISHYKSSDNKQRVMENLIVEEDETSTHSEMSLKQSTQKILDKLKSDQLDDDENVVINSQPKKHDNSFENSQAPLNETNNQSQTQTNNAEASNITHQFSFNQFEIPTDSKNPTENLSHPTQSNNIQMQNYEPQIISDITGNNNISNKISNNHMEPSDRRQLYQKVQVKQQMRENDNVTEMVNQNKLQQMPQVENEKLLAKTPSFDEQQSLQIIRKLQLSDMQAKDQEEKIYRLIKSEIQPLSLENTETNTICTQKQLDTKVNSDIDIQKSPKELTLATSECNSPNQCFDVLRNIQQLQGAEDNKIEQLSSYYKTIETLKLTEEEDLLFKIDKKTGKLLVLQVEDGQNSKNSFKDSEKIKIQDKLEMKSQISSKLDGICSSLSVPANNTGDIYENKNANQESSLQGNSQSQQQQRQSELQSEQQDELQHEMHQQQQHQEQQLQQQLQQQQQQLQQQQQQLQQQQQQLQQQQQQQSVEEQEQEGDEHAIKEVQQMQQVQQQVKPAAQVKQQYHCNYEQSFSNVLNKSQKAQNQRGVLKQIKENESQMSKDTKSLQTEQLKQLHQQLQSQQLQHQHLQQQQQQLEEIINSQDRLEIQNQENDEKLTLNIVKKILSGEQCTNRELDILKKEYQEYIDFSLRNSQQLEQFNDKDSVSNPLQIDLPIENYDQRPGDSQMESKTNNSQQTYFTQNKQKYYQSQSYKKQKQNNSEVINNKHLLCHIQSEKKEKGPYVYKEVLQKYFSKKKQLKQI